MRLFHAPTSPFVNKVKIIIHECGLADQVEIVPTEVMPGNPNRAYGDAVNPLRQIPTLETDDGVLLFDSLVICDYLIELSGKETLLPLTQPGRTHVLKTHALISGITERAVALRYETAVRAKELQWQALIDDNWDRVHTGLKWLNENCDAALDGPFDLSEAAFVAMLRYLDFRFIECGWREKYPALVAPFEACNELASVKFAYGET